MLVPTLLRARIVTRYLARLCKPVINLDPGFVPAYGKLKGDYWSGKSRKEKIKRGILKCPKYSGHSFINVVHLFDSLNERVHGNSMVGLYWSFDKHGKYNDEYRGQVAVGLLYVLIFLKSTQKSVSIYGLSIRGYENAKNTN